MAEFTEQTNKVSDNIFAAINLNRNASTEVLEEHQYLDLI